MMWTARCIHTPAAAGPGMLAAHSVMTPPRLELILPAADCLLSTLPPAIRISPQNLEQRGLLVKRAAHVTTGRQPVQVGCQGGGGAARRHGLPG